MNLTTRNIGLLVLLLVIVAGVAGGAWYVTKRGTQRRDLYLGALQNIQKRDYVRAEEKLRTVLATDPDHIRAFTKLANILVIHGRLDDLEELCTKWVETSDKPEIGWRTYVGGLLGAGEFARAEREALRIAPDDPLLVHQVRLATRSLRTDVRSQLAAVDAARRVADLTVHPLERATALVRAGEILYGLSFTATDEVARNLQAEGDRVFSQALTATSEAKRESGGRGVEIACDMLVARILLCNGDDEEREDALRLLEARLGVHQNNFDLRVVLIGSLLRVEKDGGSRKPRDSDAAPPLSALEHARKLAEPVDEDSATSTQRLTALHEFVKRGRTDDALDLFPVYFPETEENRDQWWRTRRLRLRFLLAAGGERAEQARELALGIVRDRKADLALVGSLVQVFQLAGRNEDAIAILELARSIKGSEVLDTWLVAVLARSGGDDASKRARTLADELGRADLSLGQSAAALNQMRGDVGVLRQYLDTRIASSENARTEHRFLRLRLNLADAMNGDGAAREQARATAAEDLAALDAAADATPRMLEQCVEIAYALGMHENVGRCIAAAAGRPESLSVMPLRLVATIRTGELPEDVKTRILKGMSERGQEMPAREFLDALAAALARGAADSEEFRAVLEQLAQDKDCEVPARLLALSLAPRAGDKEAVERHARALLERLPDATELRSALAALFLREKRPADALALYPDRKDLDPISAALVATALIETNQQDAAQALLTATIRTHPNDARAFLLLAKLIKDDESRKDRHFEALRVLSAAPPVRPVQLERARLLINPDVGRAERGARILVSLLNRNLMDRDAQQSYFGYLIDVDREVDAVELCSFLLDPDASRVPDLRKRFDGLMISPQAIGELERLAKEAANGAQRTHWRVSRATASERLGNVQQALDDYRHVNTTTTGALASLNNGAWILAEMARAEKERTSSAGSGDALPASAKENLTEAREWVDVALKRAQSRKLPEEIEASISDTAAHVYSLSGEHEQAKAAIRRAIALAPAAGKYRLRLVRILSAAGDEAEARKEVVRVIAEFAGSQTEREAVILQRELESN